MSRSATENIRESGGPPRAQKPRARGHEPGSAGGGGLGGHLVHSRASSVRLIGPARSVSDSLESEADLHSLRLAHFLLQTASHFCSANRLTLRRKVRYRRSYDAGGHDDAAADSRSREAPVT